jgi:5-deoxy-glucuronate isomerase
MHENFGNFLYGYNELTNMENKHENMLMDIGIQKMKDDEETVFLNKEKETVFLLLTGRIILNWNGQKQEAKRNSVFEENPIVLHVPKGVKVTIHSKTESEVLVQKTTNDKIFEPVFYTQNDCQSDIFGENVWNDTARRVVRTVIDYSNAPYSNLVIGEVINYPGKWSSYIPHGHSQPEVYLYKFNKEQGFGAGFIGDNAYKINHNSILCIPGGPSHPQAAAPGYAMFYCWMIRHLDDNPWTSRDNEDQHKWLLEKDVKIWPEK